MDDTAIVELYWARSERAIAETSAKYGGYCRAIAMGILASAEDAEECVNDTYLGAWKAMPDQRPSKLKAFLGRITRNIALDQYDYRRAKKRNSSFDLILDELEEILQAPGSVEADYEEGETARAISAFLRQTELDARNVFLRRYFYADSIGQIAARFRMSESKVKSMLFRTRNRLREHLLKEGIAI